MGFGKKKEEATKEVLIELSKSMKEFNSRLNKLEQPQVTEPVKPEVTTEEKKTVTKEKVPDFLVQDVATKTEPKIYDLRDKENPKILDLHAAIVECLNQISEVKKALA